MARNALQSNTFGVFMFEMLSKKYNYIFYNIHKFKKYCLNLIYCKFKKFKFIYLQCSSLWTQFSEGQFANKQNLMIKSAQAGFNESFKHLLSF